MVTIQNASRNFGKKRVLSHLFFTLSQGETCGLVGLNGVGKTTFLRMIVGTLRCSSGSISVFQEPPGKSGGFYRRLGIVLDSDGFNGNLSFTDNLSFFARLKHVNADNFNSYLEKYWSHLAKKAVPVKNFSRGERMQCGLARGFLGNPDLLILDEPASNLDSDGYDLLCRLVTDRKREGAAAIISSHRLDTISQLCDSVAFLDDSGLTKICLEDVSVLYWCLRGSGLLKIVPIVESLGGTIQKLNPEEVYFMGIEKSSMPQILEQAINVDVKIVEIFLRDPVVVALESHNAR